MGAGLRVHDGGSGEPVLLLLHGLGATGDVWEGWRPLLAQRWPGRWLAPDLPGHGGSPRYRAIPSSPSPPRSPVSSAPAPAPSCWGIHWAASSARRPPAWFTSRDEAAARYLRISGLAGLLASTDPAVEAGLTEQHGRWRLAMDPGAFAVGAPDMTHLLAGSQAPVSLARGEHDAMSTDDQLAQLGVPVVTLPGLGHNAHVESPHLTITVLDPYR